MGPVSATSAVRAIAAGLAAAVIAGAAAETVDAPFTDLGENVVGTVRPCWNSG